METIRRGLGLTMCALPAREADCGISAVQRLESGNSIARDHGVFDDLGTQGVESRYTEVDSEVILPAGESSHVEAHSMAGKYTSGQNPEMSTQVCSFVQGYTLDLHKQR